MLVERISELTKAEENANVKSEQVFAWVKRAEAQRAQSAVINSLSEMKEFDKLQKVWDKQNQNERKLHTPVKMPAKENRKCCGYIHQPRQCPAYGKRCMKCNKMNHFWEVCRTARGRVAHNIEQEPNQVEESHTDMVNINSIDFNSKYSVITANLKASPNKVVITVPYKVDTGSDGNIMPWHIYKKLFPRATKEDWWQQEIKICSLKTYNRTTITQLDICKVKIEHNNKQKICMHGCFSFCLFICSFIHAMSTQLVLIFLRPEEAMFGNCQRLVFD